MEKDEHGFQAGAREIGAGYQALPDTAADQARKQAQLLATGAQTLEAAQKVRKQKGFEVFNGEVRFDHLQRELDAQAPYMPKRGAELASTVTTASTPAPVRTLNHFEAARALVGLGVAMSPELIATLKSLHTDGVPEDQLESLAARLTVRAGLRVVAGGSK